MSADVVTAEMLHSNLDAVVQEMMHLLVRSAYSTIMRESRDCSYLALDDQGRVVMTSEGSFTHATAYRRIVQATLEKFGRDGLHQGDVIVTNHPYQAGVPHTPDLAVVVPVFSNQELVAFSCSIAHKPDFGGAVPGSASSTSTELYQEGFLLPLTKLYDAGAYRQEIEDIIVSNVRHPDLVLGDARAQIGTTRVGAERLTGLMQRYGVATARTAFDEMLRLSERRLRAALSTWPDGAQEADGYLDNDGVRLDQPIRFHVRVTKRGDGIHFDFSESDDQALGPVNVRPPYVETSTFYSLLSMADPELRFNDGLREVVTFKHREGSVLNPRMPAPVGAATVCIYRLTDLLLEALGRFNPARAVAHSGGSGGAMAITWQPAPSTSSGQAPSEERTLLQYEIFGTGLGGRTTSDGVNGVTVLSANLNMTPIEILETQFPLRVRRFELLQDSAGSGKHRGGLSYRREYEMLRPATINRRADRTRFPGNGVQGGRPGRTGKLTLNPGTADERVVPGSGQYQVNAGTVVRFEGAGAGGFGNPLERDPEAVVRDVRAGWVSPEAALEECGVVIDPITQEVDLEATCALRGERSGTRSPLGV